jgi:hypothetical protein
VVTTTFVLFANSIAFSTAYHEPFDPSMRTNNININY